MKFRAAVAAEERLKATFHISLHILVGKMKWSEKKNEHLHFFSSVMQSCRKLRCKRNISRRTFVGTDRKGHHINHAEP